MHKVLTKLLENRMKKVMNGVNDQRQSSILGDGYLLHNTSMTNEAIEEVKRERKKCMFFKVDYEKAYDDFVNWDFLFYMLNRLGFGEKWVGWIRSCLSHLASFRC